MNLISSNRKYSNLIKHLRRLISQRATVLKVFSSFSLNMPRANRINSATKKHNKCFRISFRTKNNLNNHNNNFR